jgi:hypothetical protein
MDLTKKPAFQRKTPIPKVTKHSVKKVLIEAPTAPFQ